MEMITPEIRCHNLVKKFKGFTLDVPELVIPKGYCTALIGENGAGKSTLLDAIQFVITCTDNHFNKFFASLFWSQAKIVHPGGFVF